MLLNFKFMSVSNAAEDEPYHCFSLPSKHVAFSKIVRIARMLTHFAKMSDMHTIFTLLIALYISIIVCWIFINTGTSTA